MLPAEQDNTARPTIITLGEVHGVVIFGLQDFFSANLVHTIYSFRIFEYI